MKKFYEKPAMRVVRIQQQCHILSGSMNKVDGNASLKYGGGGSGDARSRGASDWDDDE